MKKRLITIGVIVIVAIAAITTTIIVTSGGKEKSPKTEEKELISITFFTDGGSSVEDLKIEKGKSIGLPTTAKDGYIFLGWFDGESEVNENTIFDKDTKLIAKWKEVSKEAKTFTISFDSKGGSKVNNLSVECGTTLPTLPTPTRTGYRFVSWADKSGKVILKGALLTCENVTLYANWEIKETPSSKTFTVTYNSNGGSNVKNSVIACGVELTLPANPTREGYTFVSWADKNGKVILNGAKLACEDITLTANWEKNKNYKCPSGYYLDGTKCKIAKEPTSKCPNGTKEDGSFCIKLTEYTQGERSCGKKTVHYGGGHTEEVQGVKVEAGTTFCYYGEVNSDQNTCTSQGRKWCNSLKKCFIDMDQNYKTVCPSNYELYTSAEILSKFGGHNNGGCYKKYNKEFVCDTSNGYVFITGSCVKTIDATLE